MGAPSLPAKVGRGGDNNHSHLNKQRKQTWHNAKHTNKTMFFFASRNTALYLSEGPKRERPDASEGKRKRQRSQKGKGEAQMEKGKGKGRESADRAYARTKEPKTVPCLSLPSTSDIYIYIYILDSHMAPYGACEVAQSTARSNAQFEAERFRTKKKHGRKCFRRKKKHARNCFRRKNKHARAVLSSAQWPQSMFEQ